MTPQFKPGDIVRLKSGGPAMTVSSEESGGAFLCQWFDAATFGEGSFKPESLELAKE